MIHQLKADRLNHSQIARRLNLDRKTVRRYLSSEPDDTARVPRKARPSELDRYRGHLRTRVSEHLHTVLRMHIEAFESLGGVPAHLLYDRTKTALTGTGGDTGEVIFNRSLLSLLHHYGTYPKACRSNRPKTTGKIECIFSYVKKNTFSEVHLTACRI